MAERLLINDSRLKHFNLDIETLSTSPRAYIASMACGLFNPWGDERPPKGNIYKAGVGLKDETQVERKKDFDTVFWWLNQSPIAIEYGLQEGKSKNLISMLEGLENYIAEHSGGIDEVVVWVRGSSFDFAILRDAYMEFGIKQPWHFWNEMDDRVLENIKLAEGCLRWKKPDNLFTVEHNPRGDVQNQINRIQYYLGKNPGKSVESDKLNKKLRPSTVTTMDTIHTMGDSGWRPVDTQPRPEGDERISLETALAALRLQPESAEDTESIVYYLWQLCGKPRANTKRLVELRIQFLKRHENTQP